MDRTSNHGRAWRRRRAARRARDPNNPPRSTDLWQPPRHRRRAPPAAAKQDRCNQIAASAGHVLNAGCLHARQHTNIPGSSAPHPISREVFSQIPRAHTLQRQYICKWIEESTPASRPQLKRALAPTIETNCRTPNNRSPCRAARFTPGRTPACSQRAHSSQANWLRK